MTDAPLKVNRRQLLLGLVIGMAFGFLLDRGGATDFDIIVGQLLLRDFTVLKIIFTSIITGMVGVLLITRYSSVEIRPKPCRWKPIMVGSLIFGVGFAVLGLCPGTAAGAMGTGAVHAFFGVVGMVVGAGVFASVYPSLVDFFKKSDMGRATIPEVLGVDARWIVLLISVILVSIMYVIETRGL